MSELGENKKMAPYLYIPSGLYNSVRYAYTSDPELAGKLAISILELYAVGRYTINDPIIHMTLGSIKGDAKHKIDTYKQKVEDSEQQTLEDQRLAEIADCVKKGWTQQKIATMIGVKQPTISKRIKLIKEKFSYLLEENNEETIKNDDGAQSKQELTLEQKKELLGF